jgi:low temperature requirement protein LtrA
VATALPYDVTMPETSPGRFHLVPMRARDAEEEGRGATRLELFFDLVFVVAIGIASVNLHHSLSDGHLVAGISIYLFAFFGIWWAWESATWFATSFANDDWLYRVVTFVQMGGVLAFSVGIESAFVDNDFALMVIGFVVMRTGMVAQWLRASRSAGELRQTALIYAVGIGSIQVLWLLWLLLPQSPLSLVALVAVVAAELAVPLIAERGARTPWHPHHISERYALFTVIVLGESLLASSNAIIKALHGGEHLPDLIALSVLALVVTASLWWIYFWPPHHREMKSFARAQRYSYGHYVVLAAAGATSAGIGVEIDEIAGDSALGDVAASLTIVIPVAVFMLAIWWLALRESANRTVNIAVPAGAVLVLLDPVLPVPIAITSLVLVAVVVVLVRNPPIEEAEERGHIVRDGNEEELAS